MQKMSRNITTYQELITAKTDLKQEVSTLEEEIKSNKVLKFSTSIFEGKSLKEPILDSLHSLELKNILASPLGNLASTFLLSNKFVRKYFIAFSIIKETVPYAFNKIKELMEQSELAKKK